MPAPAVYVLAVVGTIGAAFVFKHFVYEPHIAPKVEQWVEELVARRRARRMQRHGPVPVPASSPIPLRRRRGSRRSDTTLSDSGDDLHTNGKRSGSWQSSLELDDVVAREVSEWRSQVEGSRAASGLRHRTNVGTHALDESINPIPHPLMSPTHVITDTSAPTTPTTTLPSSLPSPSPQISPIHAVNSESTLCPSTGNGSAVPSRSSPLSQVNTLSSPAPTVSSPTPNSPSHLTRFLPEYSPPSFSSPIPSLSQSYPQELDQEHGIELLSPPSSGTSSPFSTFSPFVAPQPLSPYATIQSPDDPSAGVRSWSSSPASRALSPSQDTRTTTSTAASNYQSFAPSPAPALSHLSSPVNVSHNELRSPSPHELSYLSSPSPINFTSPHVLSPRSPHSEISDLDFGSDVDVISEQGSDISWAGVSSHSGSSSNRH